jgi:hypothetical protein
MFHEIVTIQQAWGSHMTMEIIIDHPSPLQDSASMARLEALHKGT